MISLKIRYFLLVFIGISIFVSFANSHSTLAAQKKRLRIQPQTNRSNPVNMEAIWYLVQNQMRAAIGADPCILVKDIIQTGQSSFDLEINFQCDDINKAEALAKILQPRIEREYYFNMIVTYQNEGPLPHGPLPDPTAKSYIDDVKELYRTALTGNPRFINIVNGGPWHTFFILFTSELIQYFADDFAEATRYKSETPTAAFAAALTLEPMSDVLKLNIGSSTALIPPPYYTPEVIGGEFSYYR